MKKTTKKKIDLIYEKMFPKPWHNSAFQYPSPDCGCTDCSLQFREGLTIDEYEFYQTMKSVEEKLKKPIHLRVID